MRIPIIYDNTAYRNDLQSDRGFAAMVATKEHNILFDTGADGPILMANMKKLYLNKFIEGGA